MLAARVHGHLLRRMLLKYEKNCNLAHRWESTCAPSMLESTQEVQALPATKIALARLWEGESEHRHA